MSGGFSNPVVGGGGALVYPSIHSPNFNVADPSASPNPSWAVLKNGLAYFFGLVLAGGTILGPDYIINSSGWFFYSGAPAAGNLVLSFAGADGTDQFGNPYGSGSSSFLNQVPSANTLIANMDNGVFSSGTEGQFTGVGGATPAQVYGTSTGPPSGASAVWGTGKDSASDTAAAIQMLSEHAVSNDFAGSGNTLPAIQLFAMLWLVNQAVTPGVPVTTASQLYSSSVGTPSAVTQNGFTGGLSVGPGADFTAHTVTQAVMAQLSAIWPVPANDAQNGTVYTITFGGTGTWGNPQEVFTIQIFGWGVSLTLINVGAVQFPVSQAFQWKGIATVAVKNGNVAVSNLVYNMAASGGNQNSTGGTAQSAGSFTSYAAVNVTTSVNSNITIQAMWQASTAGATITCDYSYFERCGA